MEIRFANTDEDLKGILHLQEINLPHNLSPEQITEQGFVTVHHNLPLLQRMNNTEKSVIAVDNKKVIAYTLAMTKDFKDDIPVLVPMFQLMDNLRFNNENISDIQYIVSGQACIDVMYRGKGLLDQLYAYFRTAYAAKYDYLLTEIATRNQRSMNAHKRIGFEFIHRYTAPDGEEWDIVGWNWNHKNIK